MSRLALASVLATAEAGTLAVTWKDCGAKHGKVTDLKPLTVETGKTVTVTGTGTVDEDVTGGHFTATVSALGTKLTECSGDGTKDITCKLPLNSGSVTLKALNFPLHKGTVTLPVEVTTSSKIPTQLANVDIHVAATDQNGEDAICLDVHTAAKVDEPAAQIEQQPSFEEWASFWGMNGDDAAMRANYEANVKEIDALNARDSMATYAVNQFSGMSFDEFASIYLTLKTSPVAASDFPELQLDAVVAVQDADWDVTPVKDQGQCGSCWTFGVMGAIEGMNKVTTGNEVILSEQQLVDCDKDGINDGCNGGLTDYAYKYLTGKDLYTLASYPYVSGQSGHGNSCKTGTPSGVAISGYFTVPGSGSGSQGDEALAKALMTGPVTVTVAVDNQFSNYHSGILSGVSTQCNLNHAILATGFGPNFWKIKNSWGTSWGAQGYAKFERATSGCGPFGLFFQDAGFQPKLVQSIAV